jgi:hypothetical protein
MNKGRSKKYRLLAILVLMLGALGLLQALTAANTVPASKAGDGSGAISGYVVSNVHYSLNAADPSRIDQVTFSLDSVPAPASTIKIKLESAAITWYACTNVGAAVTCNTVVPPASVLTADQLRVVVAD